MDTYQTIIVGAGPAGLSCAAHLASKGVKVLLLERNSTIGPKVCAGGIPFHAQKELAIPDHLIQNKFPIQKVRTPWQHAAISSTEPIIATINRRELGQWMLDKAIGAGATVLANTPVLSITDDSVQTAKHTFTYKTLVGADGSSSLVRRFLNMPTTKVGVGINYQVPIPYSEMEWHLDPGLFRSGYAWIFPHRESTSIGVYAERSNLPPPLMKQRFAQWADKHSIPIQGNKPGAALINFDFRGWKFGNTYLAGDAAGLASGFTGEGIYPAIISGETVAKTILTPEYVPKQLNSLIHQHKRHQQIQNFFTGRKVICQMSLEMLVIALRLKLLNFRLLEMY